MSESRDLNLPWVAFWLLIAVIACFDDGRRHILEFAFSPVCGSKR